METTIQGADWSALREHLPLFALLLFSLPPVSFLLIKVLLAANSASKQKVTKQWHISREQDEAGKSFYRGIYLTPPTPRYSVLGDGRGLSEDVA
jgi:hypothetical protein